ncbi:MAG: hypothetical protein AAF387_03455 [Pseudomonadota bacterium]
MTMPSRISVLIRLLSIFFVVDLAQAAAFIRFGDGGPNSTEPIADFRYDGISHPEGYDGNGGEIVVNVCITTNSEEQQQMLIPTENAIRTWNRLEPITGNAVIAGSGVTGFDYESVLLHELGHCMGLEHPNLGTPSGVSGSLNQDSSRTSNGPDNVFNIDAGDDGVIGSSDDIRGDDVNLNWFIKGINNPFDIVYPIDSTNYSINLVELPATHNFVANAAKDVGELLGYPNSEAVMQQGTRPQEAQRDLGHDDVIGLRLGMSGIDETSGTADDYTVQLNFLGISDSPTCNIRITMDSSESNFAICSRGNISFAVSEVNDHYVVKDHEIRMDGMENWYFNQVSNNADTDGDGLSDDIENAYCTDAVDADTDDDGLDDGMEDADQDGFVDVGETDPCSADSDGDGIQDGTELGVTTGGSDTNLSIFVPDADPNSTTLPLQADTDGDGFNDGEEDLNANGQVNEGESDPNNVNSLPLNQFTIPWGLYPSLLLIGLLALSARFFILLQRRSRFK